MFCSNRAVVAVAAYNQKNQQYSRAENTVALQPEKNKPAKTNTGKNGTQPTNICSRARALRSFLSLFGKWFSVFRSGSVLLPLTHLLSLSLSVSLEFALVSFSLHRRIIRLTLHFYVSWRIVFLLLFPRGRTPLDVVDTIHERTKKNNVFHQIERTLCVSHVMP